MTAFAYTARDAAGLRKEGCCNGSSEGDVVNWIRRQQMIPVSVRAMSSSAPKARRRTGKRARIRSSELAAICWQLTTMLEGGVAITTSLETISGDIDNQQLKDILKQIQEGMEKGQPFSEGVGKFPKVFNHLCCAMISAGEAGGNLPMALKRLAIYFDNRDKLAKKVKGAVAYPAFVLVFVVLIVAFIMTFIIPRFEVMFKQFGGNLPAFTRGFMAVYNAVRLNFAYAAVAIIIVVFCCVVSFRQTRRAHYFFCKLALSVPLLGRVFSQAFIALFCRTMATLLASGVAVLEVFEILAGMTGNDIIRTAILQTRERIIQGSNISDSMAESEFFPNMLVKMVQVGEESGSLSSLLDRTSDYYERKVDSTISTVTGLLEPIMIVTVGSIVLVVVLALYLPIFSMSEVRG